MSRCAGGWLEELSIAFDFATHELAELIDVGVRDLVEDEVALFAALDEVTGEEDGEVFGDVGLGEVGCGGELADGFFAVHEAFEDGEAGLVGEDGEEASGFSEVARG